mmetsp:Transcript_15840/g.20688  ORF Transcript_15840/g.20688 Transcript_15840/m.20688 type:complete len:130 (-) Transcript_15840:214-603(-)
MPDEWKQTAKSAIKDGNDLPSFALTTTEPLLYLRFASSVIHHLILPKVDLLMFSRFSSNFCFVHCVPKHASIVCVVREFSFYNEDIGQMKLTELAADRAHSVPFFVVSSSLQMEHNWRALGKQNSSGLI